MTFKATFNNISVISWQSVLLVEETGVAGENHWHVASHWQTLSLYTPRKIIVTYAHFRVDISTFLKTNLVPNLHSHFLQHRKVSEIKWEKLNIIVKHLKKNQILYKTFFHWLINVCRQINKHVVIKDSSRHIEILKMLITKLYDAAGSGNADLVQDLSSERCWCPL
jgi:hypothetical protein